MRKPLNLALAFLLLTGCGRQPAPDPPRDDEPKQPPRAELRIGNDPDGPRHLPFTITAVYDKQRPSAGAPFHAPGGEWTFFDCQAVSDPKVAFTAGVLSRGGAGDVPIAWGKAVLIVKDREAGARFVACFGKAFAGKVPPPVPRPHVPRPLAVNTAVLGQNTSREDKGGFVGKGGGWTATKWFPEHDGRSGEMYFNYNLAKRQGEFSEKDGGYADDLVATFASALRDGPRPERTPETDANLSRTGPALGRPRKLLPRMVAHYLFSPGGRFAVYEDGSALLALPTDKPDGKPFELVHLDHSPWDVRVLNEDLDCLVQEGVPEKPGVKSSGDPMRIWWVGHKGKEKKLLRGPEKDISLAEAPVSPGHRYVALQQWRDNPGGKGRTKLLHVLDREGGKAQVFAVKGKSLSLVGWKMTEAGPRGVAVTNRWGLDEKEAPECYLVGPSTGKLERQENADARFEIDNLLSPDGKHRVRVGKGELVVTAVPGGERRRFTFHEDDRRFVGEECVEWAGPRYLKFNGPRLALIDVTTMKMCFPKSADGARFGSHAYKFSPDIRWVLYQGEGADGEGLFLAPVEVPKDG
jgi:hypothetical protein